AVRARLLDWIAGVAQLLELDALHDTAVLHVEARDDPAGEHSALLRQVERRLRLAQREALLVERGPGDRSGETRQPSRGEILEVREGSRAAAGDERSVRRRKRQLAQELQVEPFQRSVARDCRHHEPLNADAKAP